MDISDTPADELEYEQAFEELERIVAELESETLPLKKTIALYERGQKLVKRCADLLEQAELRIRELSPDAGS